MQNLILPLVRLPLIDKRREKTSSIKTYFCAHFSLGNLCAIRQLKINTNSTYTFISKVGF